MKVTYRVPVEQYAFVEVEDVLTFNSLQEEKEYHQTIREKYDNLTKAFKDNPGLTEKEMDAFLDAQLSGNGIKDGVELYEKMNNEQKTWAQRIKRAIKRKN